MVPVIPDLSGWAYRSLIKPTLFCIPADRVHENALRFGNLVSKTPPLNQTLQTLYAYQDPILTQTLDGITWQNPLGLAAGFDYTASLPRALSGLGFGFGTVGTVSAGMYPGNPPPMLGRAPHSQALWVNKGFKSPGVDTIIQTLKWQLPAQAQIGISVGATNRAYSSTAEQVAEYETVFVACERSQLPIAYYELNISCPNLAVGSSFQSASAIQPLLNMVAALKLKKPLYVKMPIDLPIPEFLDLVEAIVDSRATQGVIIGNLTKDRQNPALYQTEIAKFTKGGFSGKPTMARSNDRIAATRAMFGKELTIIGCGGVFTAQDAYQKIQLGASLVQLITGLIYRGPQVVGQINRDLVKLLKQDGFETITDAVGSAV